SRRIPNTTDDVATVMFRIRGGGMGHFETSRVSTGVRFDIGYEIVGTEGTLRYDYERINDLDLYRETGPVENRGFTRMKMGPTDPRYAALLPVPALGPAYPDFGFGHRVQQVVDACQKSHAEHAWVKVGV